MTPISIKSTYIFIVCVLRAVRAPHLLSKQEAFLALKNGYLRVWFTQPMWIS
jgi:hypothetical protein